MLDQNLEHRRSNLESNIPSQCVGKHDGNRARKEAVKGRVEHAADPQWPHAMSMTLSDISYAPYYLRYKFSKMQIFVEYYIILQWNISMIITSPKK